MKYYAIAYINKIINFLEYPDSLSNLAKVSKNFWIKSLNLDLDKTFIKELTEEQYCQLLTADDYTFFEFDNKKIKKSKNIKKEQEIAEVVDWRYELFLEDYYSSEEIQKILQNRDHIAQFGLENIPNIIPTKYKSTIKELDVKEVYYEIDCSSSLSVTEVLSAED